MGKIKDAIKNFFVKKNKKVRISGFGWKKKLRFKQPGRIWGRSW